jgi:hypothetical protein
MSLTNAVASLVRGRLQSLARCFAVAAYQVPVSDQKLL